MDNVEAKTVDYGEVKIEAVPKKIKFSEMTTKAIKKWYRLQRKVLKVESYLMNAELSKTNDEKAIGTKREIKKIQRAILKYEKLKDKLNLLIDADYKSKYAIKARAIKLKEIMFENFKFNGKKYILTPEARDDIFINNANSDTKDNDSTMSDNDSTMSDNISDELKGFGSNKENNEIIQDLPINSKEENVFNTPGMTDEEIKEAQNNIGEYHPLIKEEPVFNMSGMTDEEIENAQNNIREYLPADKNIVEENIANDDNQQANSVEESEKTTTVANSNNKEALLDYIMNKDRNSSEELEKTNNSQKNETIVKPDGTIVEYSADKKSKMYDFSNVETPNESFKTADLNINDLNNYRQELLKVKEARQRAQEEALSAQKAEEIAKAAALRAKEDYQRKIDEENKKIEEMNAQARKAAKSAEMANDYTKSIEDMLSQLNGTTDENTSEVTKEGNSK